MNSKQQRTLQIGLIIVALFCLSGCGSSRSGQGFGSADSGSNSPTGGTPPPTGDTAAQAVCSKDIANLPDLQVNLMQFVDVYGQPRSDYVRLQFKKAPAGWQAGNWDMQIYRWTASSTNETSLDSTPLAFQFEKKAQAGFQLIHTNFYPIFNWEEVVAMGTYAEISAANPQDFFNTVTLLVNLRDTTNSFQALRVIFYSEGTVMQSVDVLIPTFQADPALYNADSRHPATLQYLHPLKDKLGQNWTQYNYYEFAKGLCF